MGSAGLKVWVPWAGGRDAPARRNDLGSYTLGTKAASWPSKNVHASWGTFFPCFLPAILLALAVISSAATNIQMSVGSSLSWDIAPVLAMATAMTATALWR